MPGRYLSIGIDHGTTHSCIAAMDDRQPRVIRSFSGEDRMPSAVYFDKRGRRLVGQPALESMKCFSAEEGNGYTGYRNRIGQEDRYEFTAAHQVMTAPELGGLVIGELLRAYQEDTGEWPQAAVITVPAWFGHSACEGTRMAARLAGLSYSPLIQEPIAAALAYRFTTANIHARWMVFDLGDGTLDVSLVMSNKGQVIVPLEGYAGDTRLGGRKFEREIMTYVLAELRKRYALNGFAERHPIYDSAWSRLLLACEEAMIRLGQKSETVVEVDGPLCKDERGTAVKVEVPVTRQQYEKMIAADVERAIHACQLLLARNRLTPKEIDRLILVGGPTRTPYLRQVLADRLGIPLDTSIDPMTAVAVGAALYAATVEIPVEEDASAVAVPAAAAEGVELLLEYERKSSIPTHCVTGRVTGSAAAAGGLTFEIRRQDGLWSSMPQPIDETGLFSCAVLLLDEGQPRLSSFTTLIRDRSGRLLASQDEPQIGYPLPEKARLANSLLMAAKDNETVALLKHGAELPAKNSFVFEIKQPIRKGSREDILRLPILEAVTNLLGYESSHADCNIHVGTLIIEGSDPRVTCDLPIGTDVKVEIHMDESREIRAVAYIPLLDEEFEATFRSEGFQVDAGKLPERFAGLKDELRRVEELQKARPGDNVAEALDTVRRLGVIQGIETELKRAREGEPDAQYRAYRRILELAGTLHQIHGQQQTARIGKRFEDLQGVAGESDLNPLRQQLAEAGEDPAQLRQVEEALDELDMHLLRKPYVDILVDLHTLSGLRVTWRQHQRFNRANSLFERIIAKSGMEVLQLNARLLARQISGLIEPSLQEARLLQEEFPSEDGRSALSKVETIARRFSDDKCLSGTSDVESEVPFEMSNRIHKTFLEFSAALKLLVRLQTVARLKRQIRMLRPAIEGTDISELLEIERELRDRPEDLEALDRLHARLVNLAGKVRQDLIRSEGGE